MRGGRFVECCECSVAAVRYDLSLPERDVLYDVRSLSWSDWHEAESKADRMSSISGRWWSAAIAAVQASNEGVELELRVML